MSRDHWKAVFYVGIILTALGSIVPCLVYFKVLGVADAYGRLSEHQEGFLYISTGSVFYLFIPGVLIAATSLLSEFWRPELSSAAAEDSERDSEE